MDKTTGHNRFKTGCDPFFSKLIDTKYLPSAKHLLDW
jgi:hypothetical protein